MPDRTSMTADYHEIIAKAEAEGKNPAAVMLGRLGGSKGGKARMTKLTKEQRQLMGRKGARVRWARARAKGN